MCRKTKKTGENMNRKIMILMVAVVATVLPAVAVADVMITGNVYGVGSQAPDAFWVQDGSNYASAHSAAGFTWTATSSSESEILGTITLGVMTNETIYEINVLDINFSAPGYFNLTVNVPSILPSSASSEFASGTSIFFSTSPFNFVSGAISPTTTEISLSSPGSTTINFGSVSSSTTIYVAFEVGSGPSGNASFSLTGTFAD